MEHEHDGGADGRRGAGVGAGAAAPAMLGAAGTVRWNVTIGWIEALTY